MKTVKIFLASSIEDLKEDRVAIGNYFRQLNDIYIKKGIYFELVMCEDYDNAMAADGKQSQYDREISDSELCFFLFFRKAGEYTRHEFEVAMESFKDKEKPKIITYFKDVTDGESVADEVRTFMAVLDGEFKHYYNTYGHIDTLKLGVIMQIKLMKLDSSEMKVEDGEVKLDGVTVAKSENVPILNGNDNLRTLTAKKCELQAELDSCRKAYLADPTPENESAFFTASTELNKVSRELTALEKEVLDFMSSVAEMTSIGKELTEREKKALEYFNKGEYDNAKAVLEDVERENELERFENYVETGKNLIDSGKNGICGYIRESLLWIKAETAKGINAESAVAIGEKYKKIAELTGKYDLDRWVLFEYASFLRKQKQISEALAIAEELREYYDTHELVEEKEALLLYFTALLYKTNHEHGKSELLHFKAMEIREKLCRENPELYEADLASSYNDLANLYKNARRFDEAESYYLKAISIRERLCKENPEAFEVKCGDCYYNLATLYKQMKHFKESEEYFLRAIAIDERLSAENPLEFERNIAMDYNNLSNLYSDMDNNEKATEYCLKSMKIKERLAARNPEAYEPELAITANNLAILYKNMGMTEMAETHYLNEIEIRKRLCIKNREVYEGDLAYTYNNLAALYVDTKRYAEAEEYHMKALEIWKRLCQKTPDEFEPDLALSYSNLAGLCHNIGRLDEAKSYYIKSIEIRERLSKREPRAFEASVAYGCNQLAGIYFEEDNFASAKEYYLKALPIKERLSARDPDYVVDVAACCWNLGITYEKTGDKEKAKAYYKRSRALYTDLNVDGKHTERISTLDSWIAWLQREKKSDAPLFTEDEKKEEPKNKGFLAKLFGKK